MRKRCPKCNSIMEMDVIGAGIISAEDDDIYQEDEGLCCCNDNCNFIIPVKWDIEIQEYMEVE